MPAMTLTPNPNPNTDLTLTLRVGHVKVRKNGNQIPIAASTARSGAFLTTITLMSTCFRITLEAPMLIMVLAAALSMGTLEGTPANTRSTGS